MGIFAIVLFWAMFSAVGYFAYVPLKAAAASRFRGKDSLTIEGIAFLALAVGAILIGGAAGWLMLGTGIVAGAGMRSRKGNENRYLD